MPYQGEIRVGDLFVWEPDLSHAREDVIVVRIDTYENDESKIWTRSHLRRMHLYFNPTVWNDESRFREAVVPSQFKCPIVPLQDWETMNPHAELGGPWPERMNCAVSR